MNIKKGLQQLLFLSAVFFASILISNIVKYYIPSDILNAVLGKNLMVSIIVSSALGIILPLPAYGTYPIAHALYLKGAFISAASAMIWGEVIISDVASDIIEIKYFGKRFWLARLIMLFSMIVLSSIIVEAVL